MICCPDTNLLVYVHDGRDPEKQRIATLVFRALAERDDGRVALQVMGELYAVLTRKLRQDRSTATAVVRTLSDVFEPFEYAIDDVHTALSMVESGVLSYWDGLLVSSAARAGCTILISEDMHDTFRFGTLEVVAPFADGRLNPRLGARLSIA